MASRRSGPTEVLAFKSADVNDARRACGVRSISVAHRTRLPGIKRRTGPGSLRRSKLARLSPPCDAVHRSLRIPDRRTRRFFPQWNSPRSLAAISHTHRFPTTRIFRCALNVMFPRRSLLAALSLSPHLRQSLRVAQPVCNRDLRKVFYSSAFYDTVVLGTNREKVEREWACAIAYRTSDERRLALPAWLRYYSQERQHSDLNYRSRNSCWPKNCPQPA